jgi:hypothetical protein
LLAADRALQDIRDRGIRPGGRYLVVGPDRDSVASLIRRGSEDTVAVETARLSELRSPDPRDGCGWDGIVTVDAFSRTPPVGHASLADVLRASLRPDAWVISQEVDWRPLCGLNRKGEELVEPIAEVEQRLRERGMDTTVAWQVPKLLADAGLRDVRVTTDVTVATYGLGLRRHLARTRAGSIDQKDTGDLETARIVTPMLVRVSGCASSAGRSAGARGEHREPADRAGAKPAVAAQAADAGAS